MSDERTAFLDRASIAFAATGMNAASACALAEKLLEERTAQDERFAEQARAESSARMAAEEAKAVAAALDAAAGVELWSCCPWVSPIAEDAFNDALAARGMAVWKYGHEAWIVSKAESDEMVRDIAAIQAKHQAQTNANNARYRQEKQASAKKSWESTRARLRAEASS